MDDQLWDLVWERQLTGPERNFIARAVWFDRPLPDPFEARIGAELARRWRRQCISMSVLFGVWTLFWGALTLDDLPERLLWDPPVAPANTLLGMLVIVGCIAVFRRMGNRPLTARI